MSTIAQDAMRPLRTPVPNDFQPDQASHWLLMTSTCYDLLELDVLLASSHIHLLEERAVALQIAEHAAILATRRTGGHYTIQLGLS